VALRRILALGGHDFDRRVGNDAICDLIVELAESPRPRICLLPTASGDHGDQIARFRRAFAERDCAPEVISLFRLGENPVHLREELLAQDVIYAGGGSMVNLAAIWRAHSQGEPAAAAGLGLLPGSACVHYLTEPVRRRRFLRAIGAGELEPSLGLEDQTGALFEDTELAETISARHGAEVWKAALDGSVVVEAAFHSRRLEDDQQPINDTRAEILEVPLTLAARASRRRSRPRRPGRLD
jgi:hypothetical protein